MTFTPCVPRFYTDNGDCVVSVDKTFFNINRALFSQHSVVFHELFRSCEGLPAEWTRGTSIALCGDPPDDFRYLCWVLQTCDKLRKHLDREPGDLARLVSLRGLFDKYKCTAYVEQALLFRFPRTCPLDHIQPSPVLVRLTWPGSPIVLSSPLKFGLVVADGLASDVWFLYQSCNVIGIITGGPTPEVEDDDAMVW
ncbi:hypothetical protein C8R44DRAFT_308501 [Mycena epipterygia]|nr:hypothetical protein C8R44DRAFT_308501 [Mycena epipterygia]